MRYLLASAALAAMLFCAYGFLAAFELAGPNVWHVLYGAGFFACAGIGWAAIGKDLRGIRYRLE